ncbi:MAG: alpha-glucosidase C-terminal domain-containing protein [Bacteroidetes bacterium]|nr:alpha-glucosidase C-terminal domain-containing protein [Bacteroidota bacterium]MBS1649040.1 alpha-glucosidase C-terminal domain-containing protein [Bacteroidota bacterium]
MNKIILITVLFLTGITNTNAQTNNHTKQKGEIIYHVFQRSFYDSNGDLHGDLNGLRQKLDYLQNLGVTSILLLPLYEADCYHNYFANNFEKIDSKYGTMNDYIALVKEIHKKGMKIYLDMETQYVTEKHKWWKDAVGNLKSPYSNYILFQDAAHTKPETMVFGLTELNSYDGSKIKVTTVNLKSKEVLDYNIKLFSFFADPNKDGKFDDGVDGFRLDHTMDNLDKKPTLTNLLTEFWLPLIKKLKALNGNIKFMAEQAEWRDLGFDYFEKADIDRVFAFGLRGAILSFKKQGIIKMADTLFKSTPKGKEQIVFIENHDMDRSATVLKGDSSKERVAAALSLLIGGVPSIYYGQEIGMCGHGGFGLFGNTDGNDIPTREAFEWYKSGTGKGMALWYKNTGPWWDHTNIKPNDGISLEEQQNNKNSLFNFYKQIISLRKNNSALSIGNYQNAENDNNYVFSFTRQAEKEKVLVAVNLSNENQTVNIKSSNAKYIPLYGTTKINTSNFKLTPYEIMVWKIQ